MICASLLMPVLFAFNPPTETAGPVKLSISVKEIKHSGVFSVTINNTGADRLKGRLSLKATKPWSILPEAGGRGDHPIDLLGRTDKTLTFRLHARGPVFPEFYAIHATGTFQAGATQYTLHPIALFKPDVPWPAPPRQARQHLAGQVPESGGSLVDLGIAKVSFRTFRDREWLTMPQGWSNHDGETGCYFHPSSFVKRGLETFKAITFHPPWRTGPGVMTMDFPLIMPQAPMLLTFYKAIRDHRDDEPPSDGITFQVSVLAPEEKQLFLGHSKAKVWFKHTLDLSAYRGKKIILRLTGDPGPRKDTTCDQGYFGGLFLTPKWKAAPPKPGAAITHGLAAGKTRGQPAWLSITQGKAGIWDSKVTFIHPVSINESTGPETGESLAFTGFEGQFLLADGRAIQPRWFIKQVSWTRPSEDVLRVHHQLTTGGAITCTVKPVGRTFSFAFKAEGGELLSAGPGPFNKKASRVYTGPGNVIQAPATFTLNGDGHQMATRFTGFDFPGMALVMATDIMPERLEVAPDQRIYRLVLGEDPVFYFTPGKDSVFDALRTYRTDITESIKPSAGIHGLKGRFVFDLWGGHYRPSAEAIATAAKYGLTHSVVVWHNWQRWGYDYRLPEIFPPNPRFGSRDDFRRLAKTCKERDILFAPHDNYIDIYPDFPGFTYDYVCMTAAGRPVRAWFNRGRNAQSYRFRPDCFMPFLKDNVRLLNKDIAPTSYFIDVFSSIGFFAFHDAEGNRYSRRQTRAYWAESFNWIREALGGNAPQISESGHDGLIGALDGAQTNHLRVDADAPSWTWKIPCGDTERIPWFDFVWHDKFVLHGAGYPPRYAGSLPTNGHGWQSDDYMTTEVLTGHPAMVSRPMDRHVVRKYFLWHDFANHIGLVPLTDVTFVNDNLHTQKVSYANGATVLVNRGKAPFALPRQKDKESAAMVLPQYGFFASGKNHEAAIALRQGRIVEWAQSPGHFYANARNEADAAYRIARSGKMGDPVTIDFGFCRTDGALRLVVTPNFLTLTPLPDSRAFSVWLPHARFPSLKRVEEVEIIALTGDVTDRLKPVNTPAGLSFRVPAKTFQCRLHLRKSD